VTWAAIFRHYFEAKGWSPERVKMHTPGQLAALAGREAATPSFRSLDDVLAWQAANKAKGA
jgi:hypothetical protein